LTAPLVAVLPPTTELPLARLPAKGLPSDFFSRAATFRLMICFLPPYAPCSDRHQLAPRPPAIFYRVSSRRREQPSFLLHVASDTVGRSFSLPHLQLGNHDSRSAQKRTNHFSLDFNFPLRVGLLVNPAPPFLEYFNWLTGGNSPSRPHSSSFSIYIF